MVGRKKVAVACLFSKAVGGTAKTEQVKCNFCCLKLSKGGTRMRQHIKKCVKCPNDVKKKYDLDADAEANKVSRKVGTKVQVPNLKNLSSLFDVYLILIPMYSFSFFNLYFL